MKALVSCFMDVLRPARFLLLSRYRRTGSFRQYAKVTFVGTKHAAPVRQEKGGRPRNSAAWISGLLCLLLASGGILSSRYRRFLCCGTYLRLRQRRRYPPRMRRERQGGGSWSLQPTVGSETGVPQAGRRQIGSVAMRRIRRWRRCRSDEKILVGL
jgi:hypothetical protein